MEQLESSKEGVEDVVGWEHFYKPCSIIQSREQDPGGIHATPSHDPRQGKQDEDHVTRALISCVSCELGEL